MTVHFQRAGTDRVGSDPARLTDGAHPGDRLLLPLRDDGILDRTGPQRLPRGVAGFQIATRDGENIQGDPDDPSGHPSYAILDWPTATGVLADHPDRTDLALQIIFDGEVEEPIHVRAAA